MKYLLITFEDNWADEIDVEERQVLSLTNKEYEDLMLKVDLIKKSAAEFCYVVGSNECIDYSCGGDFIDAFDFRDLTTEQYELLKELGIGTCMRLKWRIEDAYETAIEEDKWIEEEDEEEEE